MKKIVWISVILLPVLLATWILMCPLKADTVPPLVAVSEKTVQADSCDVECFPHSWLELPDVGNRADAEYCQTHYALMDSTVQRNYTYLYDKDTYMSYWVAYPLCVDHTVTGREETWGYGASLMTENYPKNFYARGHQLPNADRNAVSQMQAQTYYSTNMTPQIQHGFNGGIWAKLEEGVRKQIPQNDTLYYSDRSRIP